MANHYKKDGSLDMRYSSSKAAASSGSSSHSSNTGSAASPSPSSYSGGGHSSTSSSAPKSGPLILSHILCSLELKTITFISYHAVLIEKPVVKTTQAFLRLDYSSTVAKYSAG